MKKKKEDNQNKNKNKKIKKTIIIERNIPSMTIPSIFKIGYPCQNRTLNLSTNHFFKMSSYSTNKLIETIKKNLNDLEKILDYNIQNNIFFFRIGSKFIPFASHYLFKDKFNWMKYFSEEFKKIGIKIKSNNIRISMHPDQFVLLNSLKEEIFQKSVSELEYHCQLLDAMELNYTHKIQIHVGGIYDNKQQSIERFIERYNQLNIKIKKRLVIENDDRLYSLRDCIEIHKKTGIPILFDNLHHECLNNNELLPNAICEVIKTWNIEKDGIPMMDYSSQEPNSRKGKHATSINENHFFHFIKEILYKNNIQVDIMFEIKDKEKSVLKILSSLYHSI